MRDLSTDEQLRIASRGVPLVNRCPGECPRQLAIAITSWSLSASLIKGRRANTQYIINPLTCHIGYNQGRGERSQNTSLRPHTDTHTHTECGVVLDVGEGDSDREYGE